MGRGFFSRRVAPRLAASLLVFLALGACTYSAKVSNPAVPSAAQSKQVPLAMGVYYPPEFLNYVHRQSIGGSSLTFNVGNTSATHFSDIFASYFDSAVQFPARPTPEAPAGGVDAVLIPQIESMQTSTPGPYGWGGAWTATLVYRFQMVDPTGLPIATWLVHGSGGASGITWLENPAEKFGGESYNKALAAAGRNFVETFAKEDAVSGWLRAQGVQTTQQPVLTASRPAVLIAAGRWSCF